MVNTAHGTDFPTLVKADLLEVMNGEDDKKKMGWGLVSVRQCLFVLPFTSHLIMCVIHIVKKRKNNEGVEFVKSLTKIYHNM